MFSLLNGLWEHLDIDDITEENVPYEMITVPDSEDPYGGQSCICSCHEIEDDAAFKARTQHCVHCGKKVCLNNY